MADYMLTTVDNPYNPQSQFDEWYAYDTQAGHHTLALLGRIVNRSIDQTDADQWVAYDRAMDEIVLENVSGVHRKVDVQTFVKT